MPKDGNDKDNEVNSISFEEVIHVIGSFLILDQVFQNLAVVFAEVL
jgi:hypothetical protein